MTHRQHEPYDLDSIPTPCYTFVTYEQIVTFVWLHAVSKQVEFSHVVLPASLLVRDEYNPVTWATTTCIADQITCSSFTNNITVVNISNLDLYWVPTTMGSLCFWLSDSSSPLWVFARRLHEQSICCLHFNFNKIDCTCIQNIVNVALWRKSSQHEQSRL